MQRPSAAIRWFLAIACATLAPVAHAQRLGRMLPSATRSDIPATTGPAPAVSPPRIAGGAVLGAAVGAVTGFFVGGSATRGDCDNPDACLGQAMPGFIWGTAVGMTLGAPVGANLANRGQGSLWKSVLVSTALLGVETVAIRSMVEGGRTNHAQAVIAIAVATPALQIIASSIVESRTSR